jgi:hypothetical protein
MTMRSTSRGSAPLVADEVRSLGHEELVDDAVLVASELATNAVLHAGGIVAVRVVPVPQGARIEVHDGTRVPPLMTGASTEAMTGRGLRLVAALSARWAAEPIDGGKSVWAELSETPRRPSVSDDELLDLWDDATWPDAATLPVRHPVSLGEVPTALLLAAKSHVDNLVREFTLAARGAESGISADSRRTSPRSSTPSSPASPRRARRSSARRSPLPERAWPTSSSNSGFRRPRPTPARSISGPWTRPMPTVTRPGC